MNGWPDVLRFTAAMVTLVALTVLLLRAHRVPLGWAPAVAVVRAAVQLAAIATLLSGVAEWPWLALAFIALMFTTASWTAAGRAADLPRGRRNATIAVLVGGGVAIGAVIMLGLVPFRAQQTIAIAGIVIGNAMATVTLTARHLVTDLLANQGEVEGWLALGATPSQATARLRRESIVEALLPNLDQTRSTGLVTLPGAFIGALFGGASPLEAGLFQLTVLGAVLLGGTTAATVLSALAGRAAQLPRRRQG